MLGLGDEYWVCTDKLSLSVQTLMTSVTLGRGTTDILQWRCKPNLSPILSQEGINGGVTKPDPMLRINMGGSFTNLKIVNSPGRAIAIGMCGLSLARFVRVSQTSFEGGSSLTVATITVDNCKWSSGFPRFLPSDEI